METKREKVIKCLNKGDYKAALKIAKNFKRDFSKNDSDIIRRAYEMQHNEEFYKQLGFDKDEQFAKAVEILNKTYLN